MGASDPLAEEARAPAAGQSCATGGHGVAMEGGHCHQQLEHVLPLSPQVRVY